MQLCISVNTGCSRKTVTSNFSMTVSVGVFGVCQHLMQPLQTVRGCLGLFGDVFEDAPWIQGVLVAQMCSGVYQWTNSIKCQVRFELANHFGPTLRGKIIWPDSFKSPKKQNLSISAFKKSFGYAFFCKFIFPSQRNYL